MPRKAPLALIVLAVLVGLWLVLERSAAAPDQPVDPERAQTLSEAHRAAGTETPREAAATGPRRERVRSDQDAGSEVTEASASLPLGLRFRGRCVAAEDGAPLSGAVVKLDGSVANDKLEAEHGPTVWPQPEPITTGANGVFEFETPIALAYQFFLSCAAQGRLTRSARWTTRIPAGTVLDLGDVALMRGHRIVGRCQDASGAPAPAVVRINNLPMPIAPEMGAGDTATARTDENGVFEFTTAIPPGTWPLGAESRGWMLEEPDTLAVPEFEAPPPLVLIMRALPSIEGWLHDEEGLPVVRATVQVQQRRGNYGESSYTKEDGSFAIYQHNRDDAPVSLSVEGKGVQKREFPALIEWGTKGLKLVVARSLRTPIRVVERESGAAVENFALRTSLNANGQPASGFQLQAQYAGGLAEVGGLQKGVNYFQVIPTEPALVPSAWIEVDASHASSEPITVAVERLAALEVVVRMCDGAPVAGTNLRVFDHPLANDQAWVDARSTTREVYGTGRYSQLLSRAISDASGRATLFAPAGTEELFVDAQGPHLPAKYSLVRPFEQIAPIELLVTQGATIRGTVKLPEEATATYSVKIRSLGTGGHEFGLPHGPPSETLPADGSFSFEALEPGTYRLYLACYLRHSNPGGGSSGSWTQLDEPLAELALAAGEERSLYFEPDLPECSVTARFLLEGIPMDAGHSITLARAPRDPRRGSWMQYGAFVTDAGSRIEVSGLQPGIYSAIAVIEDAEGAKVRLVSVATAEVAPGVGNVCEFEFRRRSLVLRIVADEDGRSLAGWTCFIGGDDERASTLGDGFFSSPVTDAQGTFRYEAPAAGIYRISAFLDQERRHSEPFTIGAGSPSEPIEVRMKLQEPHR